MAEKRITPEYGSESLQSWPGIMTPWNKLISFPEVNRWVMRHNATIGTSMMASLRILVPDYTERVQSMIDVWSPNMYNTLGSDWYQAMFFPINCIHPFLEGPMIAVTEGDRGDEAFWMQGRVNDYGTYRFEKELDACPWDICGSEQCRCSTHFYEAMGKAFGGNMEFNMIEAKGCGDLHCRCVGEDRTRYPMPPRQSDLDVFGPIATEDMIKFTPEEECFDRPQHARPECDYTYRNGLHSIQTGGEQHNSYCNFPLVTMHSITTILSKGLDMDTVNFVIKQVFQASGKMAYGEFFAIKALRDYFGVPENVNDGRVLGTLVEFTLQARRVPFDIVEFDEDGCVYDIDAAAFAQGIDQIALGYISMWDGMAKTLVSAQWFAWQEEEAPEGKIRVKIAKKIDQYC